MRAANQKGYSKVAEEARRIEGVKMVDVVTGICDAIAYAEVPGLKALKELLDELHKLEGIEGTRTGIAI